MASNVSMAVNRMGLGARPGEWAKAQRDPRAWLLQQVQADTVARAAREFSDTPTSGRMLAMVKQAREERRAQGRKNSGSDAMPAKQALYAAGREVMQMRFQHAVASETPFLERLVYFWSNHFAVSVDKTQARFQAPAMENEAVRPNVSGRFSALLLAVARHPAMLGYLDNADSTGNNARAAIRAKAGKPRGLNENLAREILELHTLGVDGGYTQADVQELARALTGWSIAKPDMAESGAFQFRPGLHEPGARTLLGKRYPEGGEAQARQMLEDLAMHPATARHVSFKLAHHLVDDAPDRALLDAMARTFLATGGELLRVYRTLLEHPATWSASARKFKSPQDFLVSAFRAIDRADIRPRQVNQLAEGLGQPFFKPKSPKGFPDETADWLSADALHKRVQAADQIAGLYDGAETPFDRATACLGAAGIEGDLGLTLKRAGSFKEGMALMLASPAFQWRA